MIIKKTEKADLRNKQPLLLMVGLVTSLILVITAFEWRFHDDNGLVDLGTVLDNFDELLEITFTEQLPPPPPKVEQIFVEIEDDIEIEIPEIIIDIEITEDTEIEQLVENEIIEEEDPNEVFLIVEKEAEPVGGLSAFYKFIYDNLKYPRQARRMGIEGKVYVQFIVERDGSLTDIQIMKGIGAGCNEETLRVFEKAPKWKPAKQRGIPVRVRRAMPITFKLQ